MFIRKSNGGYVNAACVVEASAPDENSNKASFTSVTSTVVQLTPADHWYALSSRDPHAANPVINWSAPLVCWALMLDGEVTGMVASEIGVARAECAYQPNGV